MAADIIDVCDAIVSRITTGLAEGDTSTVERVYIAPIKVESISDRVVYVFPANKSQSPASRSEYEQVYRVAVIVAERFSDAGEPTKTWTDTRVSFVQDKVEKRCDFTKELLVFDTTRELWTQTIETDIYDADQLTINKLFWSEITFEFHEIKAI
jgi:hypothetical protein